MTEQDWEDKFLELFKDNLIESSNGGDDPFEEEIEFQDPNDLEKIFQEKEEENLEEIHYLQDLELGLERQNNYMAQLQIDLGTQVQTHEVNRNILNQKIEQSKAQIEQMSSTTKSSVSKGKHLKSKKDEHEKDYDDGELIQELRQ